MNDKTDKKISRWQITLGTRGFGVRINARREEIAREGEHRFGRILFSKRQAARICACRLNRALRLAELEDLHPEVMEQFKKEHR